MVNLEIQRTLFDNKFIPDDFSRTTTNLINLSKNPDHREKNISLFKYLGNENSNVLPVPLMNIINGGSNSDSPISFQELTAQSILFLNRSQLIS